jgi:hypothetical protein
MAKKAKKRPKRPWVYGVQSIDRDANVVELANNKIASFTFFAFSNHSNPSPIRNAGVLSHLGRQHLSSQDRL